MSFFLKRACIENKYSRHDSLIKEVLEVMRNYKGLTADCKEFVFPDGKSKNLIVLEGTIPINFRSNVYHIPVRIYLLNDFPASAPMCFVAPTSDMSIKVSRHVDQEGRCFFPYLSRWDERTDSNLMGVIQVMIVSFSLHPPVYQKAKETPTEPSFTSPLAQNFINMPSSTNTPYPVNQGNPYPFAGYNYANNCYPNYAVANTASSLSGNKSGTIKEEYIRASLLSAVEDKIKMRLRERLGQGSAEYNVLKKTYDDLNKGRRRLEQIFSLINQYSEELDNAKRELEEHNKQIDLFLTKFNDKPRSDIDNCFSPNEPLYKQLLDAFAEENATVDTIYYLGEALRKGVIDLESFLKNIRELSRNQFILRALMQKCREQAGLPY